LNHFELKAEDQEVSGEDRTRPNGTIDHYSTTAIPSSGTFGHGESTIKTTLLDSRSCKERCHVSQLHTP